MVDPVTFDQILKAIQQNTPRQFEVLERLLQGCSDAEIAQDLCVTRATVRKHVERLCQSFQLSQIPRQSKRLALLALFAQYRPSLPKASGPRPEPSTEPLSASCRHNLPTSDHTRLIGREAQLIWLLEVMNPQHPAGRISIEGPGGVGKTSLVLEGARRYLSRSVGSTGLPYDAMIFTSAQPQRLTLSGILPKLTQNRTRQDILRTICRLLDRLYEWVALPEPEQVVFVQDLLSRTRTLLIVDNLESLEHRDQILSFLYDLPAQTKVIITSRETAQLEGLTLRLEALDPKASLALIQHQAKQKQVQISPHGEEAIQARTGGLPAAIVYTLGQMAAGYSIEDVLEELVPATDLAQYCFGQSIAPLKGRPAHELLLTLGLFPRSAPREALQQIHRPRYTSPQIAQGLAQLHHLSLCQIRDGRYTLMPLTQEYVLAELKSYPQWETQIRERWLRWVVEFVARHSTQDWQEWTEHHALDQEWETLREAVDWCMAWDRCEEFYQLWNHLKGFSHTWGYWEERLQWMEWLRDRAEQRQDWAKVTEALTYRGRTLALINHPERWQEALGACLQAWELRHSQSRSFQFELLICIVVLLIRLERFQQAMAWLDEAKTWFSQESDPTRSSRQQIYILYYQAQIYLWTRDYDQARRLYQEAGRQATSISWQRAITYSRAWLAAVALEQEQWSEAEALLELSLQEAQHYQDRRCIALCRRSFARLEKQRGDLTKARNWVELACQDFKHLNMIQELREMETLLSGACENG